MYLKQLTDHTYLAYLSAEDLGTQERPMLLGVMSLKGDTQTAFIGHNDEQACEANRRHVRIERMDEGLEGAV